MPQADMLANQNASDRAPGTSRVLVTFSPHTRAALQSARMFLAGSSIGGRTTDPLLNTRIGGFPPLTFPEKPKEPPSGS